MEIFIKKTKEFSKKNWWIFFPIILFLIFSNIREEWGLDLPLVYAQFLSIDSYLNWHSPIIRYMAEIMYTLTNSVRSLHLLHLFFIFFGLSLITGNLFKKNISKTLAFTAILMFPSTLRYTLYFSKEQGAMAGVLMILGIIFLYINKKEKYNKNILYLTIPFMFYTYALRSFLIFFIIGICYLIFKLSETNKRIIYKKSALTILSIVTFITYINFSKNEKFIDHSFGPDGHQKSVYLLEVASIARYKNQNVFPKDWLRARVKNQNVNHILNKAKYKDYMNSMYWNVHARRYVFQERNINLKSTLNVIFSEDNFIYYLTHRFYFGLKLLYNKYPKLDFHNKTFVHYDKLFTESSSGSHILKFLNSKPLHPYFIYPNILRQYLVWFILILISTFLIYNKKWKFKNLSGNERNILLTSLIGGCILSYLILCIFAPAAIARYTRVQIMLFHICIIYSISIFNRKKVNSNEN